MLRLLTWVPLLLIIQSVASFQWVKNCDIGEVQVLNLGGENFCKFTERGMEYIGSFEQSGSSCDGLSRTGGKIKTEDNFEVLAKTSNEKIGWKYCAGKEKPSRAIPCNTNKGLGEGDCFLGQAVSGDGICDEEIGFIMGRFVNYISNGKKSRCPFRIYMVEASQDSTCGL